MSHDLAAYDYVNHDYAHVRSAVLADPLALFRRATSSGASAELHARLGAIELGAEIDIVVRAVSERRADFERPTTNLVIEWRAERNPGLFPVMQATFSLYPLSPTETQLELAGRYDPPLGVVGGAVDAMALHRFAKASVQRFVRDVAQTLRRELSMAAAVCEVAI
jgi:hypothetical protein